MEYTRDAYKYKGVDKDKRVDKYVARPLAIGRIELMAGSRKCLAGSVVEFVNDFGMGRSVLRAVKGARGVVVENKGGKYLRVRWSDGVCVGWYSRSRFKEIMPEAPRVFKRCVPLALCVARRQL